MDVFGLVSLVGLANSFCLVPESGILYLTDL